jgi:DNA-binding transcriptional LysR family regulator
MLVGNKFVAPALPEFLRRYPQISVDLLLSNSTVDLAAQNIDVDIRIGALEDSSEMVRKLADATRIACAAPSYLANSPPIEQPLDLSKHNCLTYRLHLGRTVWHFLDKAGEMTQVPVSGSLQSDNGQALLTALKAGLGVAVMPDWAVRDEIADGSLVRLFADYRVSHIEFDNGIYAVFQQSRQVSSKVRVFIDYLASYFKEQLTR